MKKNAIYLLLTSAMATMVFTSCASYKKPFEAVNKNSYTTLTEKEKCMLPKNLKLLTLEEAQNIALDNNPSFKTKYFAIAAARARYYQSFATYYPTLNASFSISQSFSRTYATHNYTRSRSQGESYTPELSGSWLNSGFK